MGARVSVSVLVVALACGLSASPAVADIPRPHFTFEDLFAGDLPADDRRRLTRPTLSELTAEPPEVVEWRQKQEALMPAANDTLDHFSQSYAATHRLYIHLMRAINEFRDVAGGTYELDKLGEDGKRALAEVKKKFDAFRYSQSITAGLGWRLYHESFADMGSALPDETCANADEAATVYASLKEVFTYHREERRVREQFWLDEFHGFLRLNLRECPEDSTFMGPCVTSWQREYAGARGFSGDPKTGERRDLKTVKWLVEERFLLGRPVRTSVDVAADEDAWMRQQRRRIAGEDGFPNLRWRLMPAHSPH